MLSLQGRQVVLAAVTVRQKGEPKALLMDCGFSTISWAWATREWADSHWEINLLWVHPVMKLRFAAHLGRLYLNILNKNNHIIANLYMIRQVDCHWDLCIVRYLYSFSLSWLGCLFDLTRRFQILHLNFLSSGCIRAVIFCLQVGFLWLGMFISPPHLSTGCWYGDLVVFSPNLIGLGQFNKLNLVPGIRYIESL